MIKKVLTIITAALSMMFGSLAMAMPGPPNATVNFNVTNPNFTITADLPGPGGENSTAVTAEFTLLGKGQAYGTYANYTNSETGWAYLSATYYGSVGDFSSTFQAEALRTNSSGGSSAFLATQGIDASGVNLLYVGGEAGACSVADTWVVGTGQTFGGTAESVTVTAEKQFEQRDSGGSQVGVPHNAQISSTTTDEDYITGISESGSYDGTTFGVQPQPGFGIAASMLSLDVQDSSGSTITSTDTTMFTDQIVGQTATWYKYPGYPDP